MPGLAHAALKGHGFSRVIRPIRSGLQPLRKFDFQTEVEFPQRLNRLLKNSLQWEEEQISRG